MASDPLVSIVIPTRNSSRTLPICLSSISRQTYGNIEIIVVDGYSTDDTVEIARRFGAYISMHRGERAMAKNLGLIMASGKYVLFLDSDDGVNSTRYRGVRGSRRIGSKGSWDSYS